jgi:hypothetical protein
VEGVGVNVEDGHLCVGDLDALLAAGFVKSEAVVQQGNRVKELRDKPIKC